MWCQLAKVWGLVEVFLIHHRRIGKVVALLDSLKEPLYLSRLWCIFEQHTAIKLNVPITMILPRSSCEELLSEINVGQDGIARVLANVGNVRVEHATASVKADEANIKRVISTTTGFYQVNCSVKSSMVNWVANVVKAHMDNMVSESMPSQPPLAFEVESIDYAKR